MLVRNKVLCGGALAGCQELTICPQQGYLTHFGAPPGHELLGWKRRQALEGFEGVPITPHGAITGPSGGDGWFIHMFAGAPIEMNISNLQMDETASCNHLCSPKDPEATIHEQNYSYGYTSVLNHT